MRPYRTFWVIAILAVCLSTTAFGEAEEPMSIEDGRDVKINLILTVNGEEILNTEGEDPVQYVHGEGTLVPGLEKGLEGLKAGDQKSVVVNAEDGFGEVDPEAFIEYAKERLPEGEIVPGTPLELVTPDGRRVPATVSEVKEEVVVLDLNHPLAGEELHFQVTVLEVV